MEDAARGERDGVVQVGVLQGQEEGVLYSPGGTITTRTDTGPSILAEAHSTRTGAGHAWGTRSQDTHTLHGANTGRTGHLPGAHMPCVLPRSPERQGAGTTRCKHYPQRK